MFVPIYSNCDNVKLQNDSVTLTFEVIDVTESIQRPGDRRLISGRRECD
jgi:hypothetical protein